MLPPSPSSIGGQRRPAPPPGSVKDQLERIEPLIFSEAEEAAVELQPAGAVDKLVDLAVPLDHRFDDPRGARGVGQISADRAALAEPGLDIVAIDAHDDGTLRGQRAS